MADAPKPEARPASSAPAGPAALRKGAPRARPPRPTGAVALPAAAQHAIPAPAKAATSGPQPDLPPAAGRGLPSAASDSLAPLPPAPVAVVPAVARIDDRRRARSARMFVVVLGILGMALTGLTIAMVAIAVGAEAIGWEAEAAAKSPGEAAALDTGADIDLPPIRRAVRP